MKTGVKIMSETDKTIARLLCDGMDGVQIMVATGLGKWTVYDKMKEWKKYYEARDYSELASIIRHLTKYYQEEKPKRMVGVYSNKQY